MFLIKHQNSPSDGHQIASLPTGLALSFHCLSDINYSTTGKNVTYWTLTLFQTLCYMLLGFMLFNPQQSLEKDSISPSHPIPPFYSY